MPDSTSDNPSDVTEPATEGPKPGLDTPDDPAGDPAAAAPATAPQTPDVPTPPDRSEEVAEVERRLDAQPEPDEAVEDPTEQDGSDGGDQGQGGEQDGGRDVPDTDVIEEDDDSAPSEPPE